MAFVSSAAAATLGAGLLGAGASIYGANKAADTQRDAANQAAAIQGQGQQDALSFQRDVFGRQNANFDASSGGVNDANDFLRGNVNYLKGNFDNASGMLRNNLSSTSDYLKGNFNSASDYLKGNFNSTADYLKGNYGQTAGNLQPFINSGIGANNLLANFYGVDGGNGINSNALAQFMNSPDYQFALRGGRDALDNSAAARGGALGGNQIRAQTEFGSGLATQNLSNYLSRISGMAGQGLSAANSLGGLGLQTGSTIGGLGESTGQAIGGMGLSTGSAIGSLGAQTGSTIGSLGAQTGSTIAGTGSSMLGGATNMASVGANLGSGLANTNAYTNLNGANNIAQSTMASGTAQAAGILGGVKGFDSGLNALTLYNQLGKSSYGGGSPTNLLSSYSGTGSPYNGNQIGQLY